MKSKTEIDPITDRALMRYFDDELDGEELEALEAALAARDAARDKLAGLGLVRDILREQVDGDTRGDGIADAVMASIDRNSDVPAAPRDELPMHKAPVTAAPANDNGRTLWTLAAAAAAVAAGLFVWGSAGPDPDPVAARPRAAIEAPAPAEPAPETLGETASAPSSAGASARDDEDAVEIAQLDFGAHSGSIFQVDTENTGVHTAVVWVTDMGDDE